MGAILIELAVTAALCAVLWRWASRLATVAGIKRVMRQLSKTELLRLEGLRVAPMDLRNAASDELDARGNLTLPQARKIREKFGSLEATEMPGDMGVSPAIFLAD